jgi:hypothetical protein
MDATIYAGSYVKETFESDFKSLVNDIAMSNDSVNMYLNTQDGEGAHLLGNHAYAYEYLAFMNALEAEISTHGVAIVVATDYRNDVHSVFVVCADD